MRPTRVRALLVAGLSALALVLGQGAGQAAGPAGARVVLWNHLNGPWSVRHSAIGADFQVVGTPVFQKGALGRAVGVVDDESLLLMPSGKFFGADNRQGTVSVLLKKGMVASVPFETPFPGVFGVQPYDFQDAWCAAAPVKNPGSDSCTNDAVAAAWGDGLSGPAGLYLQVVDSAGTLHQAVDGAFNTEAVPVGRWVHAMFVWDIHGIKGSADTMRIYRNGRLVARYTAPIADVIVLPTPVAFAGTHAAYRLPAPALLYDELLVFDRALTP